MYNEERYTLPVDGYLVNQRLKTYLNPNGIRILKKKTGLSIQAVYSRFRSSKINFDLLDKISEITDSLITIEQFPNKIILSFTPLKNKKTEEFIDDLIEYVSNDENEIIEENKTDINNSETN